MRILASLLMVLCFVLAGCASTDEEVKDASAEAAVEADTGAVDLQGEGTEEAGAPGDAEAQEAAVPEDAAAEAEVDAETDQGG